MRDALAGAILFVLIVIAGELAYIAGLISFRGW